MNMFKAVKAKTTDEYIDALPTDRKETIIFIDAFIKKVAPSLKSNFLYNMPGYGKFSYKQSLAGSAGRNHKKEALDWPTVAVASQKNYISLYVCAVQNGEYVAEKYKNDLGKVSVGKSCIRFKKIDDLNLKTLEMVIKLAAKNPGLTGAN